MVCPLELRRNISGPGSIHVLFRKARVALSVQLTRCSELHWRHSNSNSKQHITLSRIIWRGYQTARFVNIYICLYLASPPGSLAQSRGGGAWGESLVHIVCACANYLSYHTCMCYPRKYTEVSCVQKYSWWNTQKCTGEPADMPSVLQRTLLQAIVYLVNH